VDPARARASRLVTDRHKGTALVTGGASGLGAAIVARLRAEEYEVEVLDLTTGFDVSDPLAWERVGSVEVACLNAGVLGGGADPSSIDVGAYHRTLSVNLDGVVLGVRHLAGVMPAGGRIVATASLAGLTAMPDDPVYAASKHAVVGFVRSVAPTLARRGIEIDAICPGIADTPMLSAEARAQLEAASFPLLDASEVADAVWLALSSEGTGRAFAVQPGRDPVEFRFPNVPGPRTADGGRVPAPPPLHG
jgi:NAD(P)-dependent dehydrogenase (short-subunit alcohol dehydrogenase family)